MQSIEDDREQEQEDKETDTNTGNIPFETEMANVNNDEIIKKKRSTQSDEVSGDLLTIQQKRHNFI